MTDPPQRPQSVAELARRLGVSRSTVGRAIAAARTDHDVPDPPASTVDDLGREYFPGQAFIDWWPRRRRTGRPPARTTPTDATEASACDTD